VLLKGSFWTFYNVSCCFLGIDFLILIRKASLASTKKVVITTEVVWEWDTERWTHTSLQVFDLIFLFFLLEPFAQGLLGNTKQARSNGLVAF
jgi:hypothetical protein